MTRARDEFAPRRAAGSVVDVVGHLARIVSEYGRGALRTVPYLDTVNDLVAAVRAEERSRVTIEQIEATIRAAVRGRLDMAEGEWASTAGFTDAAAAVHRLITGETP